MHPVWGEVYKYLFEAWTAAEPYVMAAQKSVADLLEVVRLTVSRLMT